MVLKIEDKKAIVAEITEVVNKSVSAIAANYRGLTVTEMNELRLRARQSGVFLKVIRNTLARRAVAGTDFECMQDILVGPLVLAFAQGELSAPARLFRDFVKTNEKLVIKAIVMNKQIWAGDQLDKFASLPTKNEAIAILLSAMKAPITMLVRTMAEPHAKLVRTLAALRDKKQSA